MSLVFVIMTCQVKSILFLQCLIIILVAQDPYIQSRSRLHSAIYKDHTIFYIFSHEQKLGGSGEEKTSFLTGRNLGAEPSSEVVSPLQRPEGLRERNRGTETDMCLWKKQPCFSNCKLAHCVWGCVLSNRSSWTGCYTANGFLLCKQSPQTTLHPLNWKTTWAANSNWGWGAVEWSQRWCSPPPRSLWQRLFH